MAHVTYDGVPVYIEKINEDNGIAYIHPLNKPEKSEQVSIQNLKEH
jgi:small acid-soluble spore protein H (minor)